MKTTNSIKRCMLLLPWLMLIGCNSEQNRDIPEQALLFCPAPQVINEQGTACITPPLACPKGQIPNASNDSCAAGKDPNAPAPVVIAKANEAVLFYKRPQDGNYDGYRLHTWNDEHCDAYQPSALAAAWDNGLEFDGIDPNYGAYWILALKPGYAGTPGACGNFIIHIGVDDAGKDPGPDMRMPLSQDDPDYARMNWVFSGNTSIYEFPIVSIGVQIQNVAAHWLSADTFVWLDPVAAQAAKVRLYHSATAELTISQQDNVVGGSGMTLLPANLSTDLAATVPHLAQATAFRAELSTSQAKELAKQQLLLAAYNSADELVAATYVQTARVLDDLYTQGEVSALQAKLGLNYQGDQVKLAVWAPTAQNMMLQRFDSQQQLLATDAMTFDSDTGVWSFTANRSAVDRQYYRFAFSVYHPVTRKIEPLVSTDPYSVNVSMNGRYSQFVDLNDSDTKPAGWDNRSIPVVAHPTDIVIYEGHVRDFSILDESTPEAYRGKYQAFTLADSAPVQHLRKLAAAGLTHFHVLPLNDQANINEDRSQRVELTDTVARLCQFNAAAPVCGQEAADRTLLEVLRAYPGDSSEAQALVQSLRQLDGFNWGYDPHHFIAVEGSYASNPDGIARILEVRGMIQALNEMGLRVALDVVYNHTSSSGLFANSVFDKLVPGYYHRYHPVSGQIERSTCCENTATEHRMFDKFIQDSLVILARDFGFNDFRFDIMGHHPKAGILAAREAVRQIDPNVYFYGEGWNFGEVADNRLFVQAKQQDMAGTEVGSFNDRIREAVRSAALFSGVANDGNFLQQDFLRLSLAGTLKDFRFKTHRDLLQTGEQLNWNGQAAGYAEQPADIINYVSKHDNETLWDILQFRLPDDISITDRVRAQNMAIGLPMLSQGIPFLQFGGDFLRSKSLDRDSYDAGDWFNYVDFTYQQNNWAIGLPLAEKNQANWPQMVEIFNQPERAAAARDIEFAAAVFQEFLQIRSSSPLFRLRTAEQIKTRLGFHNVGRHQQQGVIVMSLDDGIGLTDLDPNYDAVVVMINGTAQVQRHAVPTAAGFELHAIQQQSVDSQVRQARFIAGDGQGQFEVPAYSMAVFVKPQFGAQGAGLAFDATIGMEDQPPYGSATVLVRGSMNGWGENNPLSYEGAGFYQLTLNLAAGDYEFKLASADWSTVNLGAGAGGDRLSLGQSLSLQQGSQTNIKFELAQAATVVFRLNAANPNNPTLSATEFKPYGATQLLMRGSFNGWGENQPVAHLGGTLYGVTVQLSAGELEFKLASADWATVNLGAGSEGNRVTLGAPLRLQQGSNDNLRLTVPQSGSYRVVLDAANPEQPSLLFNAEN